MQLTLSVLADRERELLTRVECVAGTMGVKHAALALDGVFEAYANVLAEYVSFFSHPDDGMEALVRAAFLVWYEVAEPSIFSGISDLPPALVNATLAALDTAAARGQLTREFSAMLGYYNSVADFAFGRGGPWPSLSQVLATIDRYSWHSDVVASSDRWARGQMSDYWASICKAT